MCQVAQVGIKPARNHRTIAFCAKLSYRLAAHPTISTWRHLPEACGQGFAREVDKDGRKAWVLAKQF
jgi:hypothetical protein